MDEEKELERRNWRRKRRKRNQIIAYLVLIVILAGLGTAGYFGVTKIVSMVNDYNQKVSDTLAETEAQIEAEITEAEMEAQEIQEEVTEAESVDETQSEPEETTDPLDELVDVLLADMTIEEKIAGLFIVAPESITGVATVTQAGNGTKTAIEKDPVGGLIYEKKNFLSESQFQEMIINTIGFCKYPLFIATDRESGEDTTFGITKTEKQSDINDTASAAIVYSMLSEELGNLNFNMFFSPVADIVSEDSSTNLVGRTFGSDAEAVAPIVKKSVEAIQESMDSVVKTFPGEGGVNSDNELTKSVEELKNAEFISFSAAVEANASAIIVSNLYAVGITGEKIPACLSSEVISLLKNDLGYKGIVMTDYLNEQTITANYSAKEAAVKAVLAGADMLLCPKSYSEAFNGVLEAVNSGEISEDRINDAMHRIYRIKYKNALSN